MTTHRARAGQPYTPPIDFAGPEPEDVEDLEQMSADILAIAAWCFIVILVLFIVAVFAGYWSMK